MKINGIDLSGYGLVLIRKSGFYDMANRIPPVVYDWGDEIQPLVEPEDISFGSQLFEINCIFDPRIGTTAQSTVNLLKGLTNILVETEGATGAIGTYTCDVESVLLNSEVGVAEKMTVRFYHRVPELNGVIPVSKAGGLKSFDGYSFSQFGIIISYKRDFNSIPSLLQSGQTTYMGDNLLTDYRALKTISINCYLLGANQTDRLSKIESFKKVLASSGLKPLVLNGRTFQTFCSTGFKCKLIGNKVLNFTVNLNVVE